MLQNDYNHESVSRNFRHLIYEKGHNNSSLAQKASVAEGIIRNLVDECSPFNPKVETLLSLADALEVEVDDILFPNGNGAPNT